MKSGPRSAATDRGRAREVVELLGEFLPLDRRRTHHDPPLDDDEYERWTALRSRVDRAINPIPGPPGAAQRELRVPADLPVRFDARGSAGLALAQNLSESGAFVATERPLPPGTPLRVRLGPEPARALELEASVVWSRTQPCGDLPLGMGLCFEALDQYMRQRLADLVHDRLSRL